jgi:CRP-like cAMP-binding protein
MERTNVSPDELTFRLQKMGSEAVEALRRGEHLGLLQPTNASTRANPRYRLSDTTRDELRAILTYLTSSAEESEEFVVRHLLVHPTIKPRDVADMLNVTEVQGSRILRELRHNHVLKIGSENTAGRGVFHVPGPRFEDALSRHGIPGTADAPAPRTT